MPQPNSPRSAPRIAVVGAGITGLAAANQLLELAPQAQLSLLEASDRVGGVLETSQRDGFLIERSADNFLTRQPWATDLCQRLGLGEQLLPTDERLRRALVVCRGEIVPAPVGFVLMAPKKLLPILRSPLLSWRGKLRLACEPVVPRRTDDADESVASFARRRLGREVFERLVQPLLAGIYTADPERLSMKATMPQFVEQEQAHGSLWRAARHERSTPTGQDQTSEAGARYGLFLAPRLGMQQLVDKLISRLPKGALQTGAPIASITKHDSRWRLNPAADRLRSDFDAVILTTPAHIAATQLDSLDGKLSAELAGIEYAGCSVVCLGYRKSQIAKAITGFGFVVPTIERRKIIAVSFASLKFPGRAPDNQILLRVFVGGALQPELADLPDDQILKLVAQELRDLLGVEGDPLLTEIARYSRGMPQYHLGHLDRVERIERLASLHAGLELAGAAYRGVGIPQCIHSGQQAAQRVVDHLGSSA